MTRKSRRAARGMTLLEAIIAVLVLVTGVAALMGMIINVENANRSMALQHASLDILARLSAQIRDAECDFMPAVGLGAGTSDPTFTTGATSTWLTTPVPGSSITLLGDATTNPALVDYVPSVSVAMRVRPEVAVNATPSFQIDVQVRQIMRNSAQDDVNLVDGYWIRVYPVQKLCNARTDATQRGEYQ